MKRWRKGMLWGSVLLSVAAGYAGAWLFAKPGNLPVPADRPSLTLEMPAPAPSASLASALTPLPSALPSALPVVAKKVRTPSLTNTRNILLAGLDRRPDGSGPSLTDTLVVVVIDDATQHVGLVSIPRDLYVDIPDAGSDRINTVYSVGKRSKRDSMALLKQVVEDTLQLPIEHALALDLGVFERAVDAVGGVDVDVSCPLRDRFLDSRVEGGRRELDVDEGERHMDGVTAAMYARSRHGRSDFHRARRQQAVLMGVQHALAGFGVTKLPDLWSEVEASVETDMRRLDLLALGRRALKTDPTHLHGMVIGDKQVKGVFTADGKAVLLPDYDAIDEALGKLFSEPSPGAQPKYAVCAPKDIALTALAR